MRKIMIEIDCDGKYCNRCWIHEELAQDESICPVWDECMDYEDDKWLRCRQCLDAEVTNETT